MHLVFLFFFLFFPTNLLPSPPRICGWYTEEPEYTEAKIREDLEFFFKNGIECINYCTSSEKYAKAARIAKIIGLKFYAWMPVLLGVGSDKQFLYDNHPEVYVVTRLGQKTHDFPVIVPHYKFLCPNYDIVTSYMSKLFHNVSKINDIDGINLDYIRFMEVSSAYSPTTDSCYCPKCIADFFAKTGRNKLNEAGSNDDQEWNEFRIGLISNLVKNLSKVIRDNNKTVTADVYPGPWQSTRQSKQRWNDWGLDMVFPMIYTGVFRRSVEWIGAQTGECAYAVKNTNTTLYTGLQAEVMSDKDFEEGVRLALANGAYGISVFKLNNINKEKFAIIQKVFKESALIQKRNLRRRTASLESEDNSYFKKDFLEKKKEHFHDKSKHSY